MASRVDKTLIPHPGAVSSPAGGFGEQKSPFVQKQKITASPLILPSVVPRRQDGKRALKVNLAETRKRRSL
jgi:hypothetical protein